MWNRPTTVPQGDALGRENFGLRPNCRHSSPFFRTLLNAAIVVACLNGSTAWAIIPSDALLQRLQPQGLVSDFAGLLTPADRAVIEKRLSELRRKTGVQFALVTLKSMEGGQIDDFAVKLFKKWGVGEKGKNNGVMLLVAIEDRKARVEVGYGLEPILPDALAGRVLDEQLFPAFKQQHYGQGLTQAVNRIAEIIERGEPARQRHRSRQGPDRKYRDRCRCPHSAPNAGLLALGELYFVAGGDRRYSS